MAPVVQTNIDKENNAKDEKHAVDTKTAQETIHGHLINPQDNSLIIVEDTPTNKQENIKKKENENAPDNPLLSQTHNKTNSKVVEKIANEKQINEGETGSQKEIVKAQANTPPKNDEKEDPVNINNDTENQEDDVNALDTNDKQKFENDDRKADEGDVDYDSNEDPNEDPNVPLNPKEIDTKSKLPDGIHNSDNNEGHNENVNSKETEPKSKLSDKNNDSMVILPSDPFKEEEDSNFIVYLVFFMFISVLGYVAYHNKGKILALVLEGRRSSYSGRGGGRRKHTAAYRKLDSNLEEAITSNTNGSRSTQNIIY